MEAVVFTLGRLLVRVDGREVPRLASRPVRAAVLVYLALEREASRDRLIATIWPDRTDERGRHALRQTLYEVRRDIGAQWLADDGEVLRVRPDFRVDALDFASAVEQGRDEAALSLYSGRFLDGCHLAPAAPFELWVDLQRARLSRLFRQLQRRTIHRCDEIGDTASAVRAARAWLAVEPWDDEAHHSLLQRLIAEGSSDEARMHFDSYAARLRAEGLEPLEETTRLLASVVPRARTGESLRLSGAYDRTAPPGVHAGSTGIDRAGGLFRQRLGRTVPMVALVLLAVVAAWRVLGLVVDTERSGARRPAETVAGPSSLGEVTAPTTKARVAVLPFEAPQADSDLVIVGLLAADWIGEGLTRTGDVQVVPASVIERLLRIEDGDASAVAVATEADVMVTGRVYRSGEILELSAQVLDQSGQRLWYALAPVQADAVDPTSAVDILRGRIMAVLAARFEQSVPLAHPSVQHPPTWAAYQLYLEAHRVAYSGRWAEARDLLDRAARLDSTFVKAKLAAASARYFLGDFEGADSLTRRLRRQWSGLAPLEQLNLEVIEAILRGDRPTALELYPRVVELYPGGEATYRWAYDAVSAARPVEALRALANVDTVPRWAPGSLSGFARITEALHLLERYDEELRAAQRADERLPGRTLATLLEGRALIGLGRTDELEALLEDLPGRTPAPQTTAPDVMTVLAAELDAHGRTSESRTLAARAVALYEAASSDGASRGVTDRRLPEDVLAYPTALLLAGRLADADSVLAGVEAAGREAEGEPGIRIRGARGVLAAELGDTATAAATGEWMESRDGRWTYGDREYWRAAIVARLGRPAEAALLLETAFEAGRPIGASIHADPWLAPLWGEEAFLQLENSGL